MCFRNCWYGAIFESHSNNPKLKGDRIGALFRGMVEWMNGIAQYTEYSKIRKIWNILKHGIYRIFLNEEYKEYLKLGMRENIFTKWYSTYFFLWVVGAGQQNFGWWFYISSVATKDIKMCYRNGISPIYSPFGDKFLHLPAPLGLCLNTLRRKHGERRWY